MSESLFERHSLKSGCETCQKLKICQKLTLNLFQMLTCIYFEKGIRGRASYISERYSKANNKYSKSYDPKQNSKHIYLDVNNLSGYAMYKFLCTSDFKWIDPKDFVFQKVVF